MDDIEVARYGLRTFVVKGGRLKSLYKDIYWDEGVMEAKCLRGPEALWLFFQNDVDPSHRAPDKNCTCGIYATLTLEHLRAQYFMEAERSVAVIAAEGPTIIGDQGLRTSAARIVAYWTPVRGVRRAYGQACGKDAQYFRKMDQMLETYGLPPCPRFPENPPARLLRRWMS